MIEKVAFFGEMCSGKTYAASFLTQEYGHHKFSLSTRLKELVTNLYGKPIDKNGPTRRLLQEIGGTYLRSFDPDCWVNWMLRDINLFEFESRWHQIVVDDVRYPNEAAALEKSGFKIVYVKTDPEIRKLRFQTLYPDVDYQEASSHKSESYSDILYHKYKAMVNGNNENVGEELRKLYEASS